MQKSDFQFTDPNLTQLNFQINNDYSPNTAKEKVNMNIQIGVHVKRDCNENGAEANTAVVEVIVKVGAKEPTAPFYIEALEEAKFRWNEKTFDKEHVDVLLNQNAAALLLSYLRPIISNVTSSSPYGRFDLPFINLT